MSGSAESLSTNSLERRATILLQEYFSDLFRVIYYPVFPQADGSTSSWVQLIFAVGPADDASVRQEVHEKFEQILPVLAAFPEVLKADTLSLRARRHVPPHSAPDHPHMFIEASWNGDAITHMLKTQRFSDWHSQCDFYFNRHDRSDPLTRR